MPMLYQNGMEIIYKPSRTVFGTKKNPYYKNNAIMGCTDYKIKIIVGGRGIGKTYTTWNLILKSNKKFQKKTLYLRRKQSEMQTALQSNGQKLIPPKLLQKHQKNLSVEAGNIYLNSNYMGTTAALTTYVAKKGATYDDIGIIFFDEFNKEKIEKNDLDIGLAFANQLETTIRTRSDVTIICTANLLTEMSDLLVNLVGFNPTPGNYGIYKIPSKSVIIHYVANSKEFEEMKAESLVGRLLKGATIDSSSWDNNITMAIGAFRVVAWEKAIKPRHSYRIWSTPNECMDIWVAENINSYVTGPDHIPIADVKINMSLDPTIVANKVPYNKEFVKAIKDSYLSGSLVFDTKRSEAMFKNFAIRLLAQKS